ncbi:uncharacterized protein LOC111299118 [Durio zibethinus]|uniref:Uncharacterized protein LOC111299118 n=1 Tax=Durio zibethinus TaxID=66656 RepID=A0A6P5ZAJ3_DURZI|nr:uncharacterized protein LOC111299118 [Durio zibethinus]
MGDLHINGGFTETPLSVHQGVVSNICHPPDFLVFPLSMDDIFTSFSTWTAYISCRFINFIENLVLQEVYRLSDDSVAITSGQNPRSLSQILYKSFQEGFSSSPTSCTENSNSGICGRRSSELREECLANTDSGILKINHGKLGVPFIFQGCFYCL